jgi:hypothetical protein
VGNFGGFTTASRRLVELSDGRTAFAKGAADDLTERWLRAEHDVYTHLKGSFMPELLGWDDAGPRPVLLLEDLSHGHWPPPWRPGDVELVLAALDELHQSRPWSGLPRLEDEYPENGGWRAVETAPAPFLGLGLVSEGWLRDNLRALRDAASRARRAGNAVLHQDVRSDNLCFIGERAVLVDWNWTSVGDPDADVVFWLPSLVLEGGESPFEPAPEMMAWVAGFFAAYAGLPPILDATGVRGIQLAQLRVALPWACRLLGLDLPEEFRPAPPGISTP